MRRVLQLGCLIFSFWMAGCAHIPFFGKTTQLDGVTMASEKEYLSEAKEAYVQNGKIIDNELLARGTKVVVVPFRAGVDVAADERLDQVALMIIKGIADAFNGDPKKDYQVLTVETAEEADLVIQGHVTNIQGPSKISRWVMLKGFKVLGVEGEILDKTTGKMVAVFTDEVKTQTDSYKDLGYQTGKNIGAFILSGIK